MEIKSTLTNRSGQTLNVVYRDVESELDLKDKKISGVHAFCFYKDKLVIVYADSKKYWTPAGGGVEEGETVAEALRREVKEETNMNVLSQKFIGYQDIYEPQGVVSQARAACLVEPYGDFASDPGGEITEIKLIDPAEYKKYFDWGVIGDHLIQRAVELKEQMQNQ